MIEVDKLKFTTIAISSFIFLAYIKQYFFYSYFHIDISNYISIQEVFTPFIDDLALNSISLLGVLIAELFFIKPHRDKDIKKDNEEWEKQKRIVTLGKLLMGVEEKKSNLSFNEMIKDEIWYKKILAYMLHFLYHHMDIVLYAMLLVYLVYDTISTYSNYKLSVTFADAYLILFAFSLIIFKNVYTIKFFKQNKNLQFYIHIFYVVCVFNLIDVHQQIKNKIYKEYQSVKYRLILNDQIEILTDSKNIYLGRTKENFFIYRMPGDKVSVYNINDITYEEVINIKDTYVKDQK